MLNIRSIGTENLKFYTAVLSTSFLSLIGCNRLCFSLAIKLYAVGINTTHNKISTDCFGTTNRQSHIRSI